MRLIVHVQRGGPRDAVVVDDVDRDGLGQLRHGQLHERVQGVLELERFSEQAPGFGKHAKIPDARDRRRPSRGRTSMAERAGPASAVPGTRFDGGSLRMV